MKKNLLSFVKIELTALVSSAWLSFCFNAFGWFFVDRGNVEFPVDQVISWMWIIFAVITAIVLLIHAVCLANIYSYQKRIKQERSNGCD